MQTQVECEGFLKQELFFDNFVQRESEKSVPKSESCNICIKFAYGILGTHSEEI